MLKGYRPCQHSLCWSPKCNNCPKCSKVLNVITFGPKHNTALNVITFSLTCNKPPMQSFNCTNIEITRKRKSTDLYIRQILGSEVHFLYCLPFARFVWVCIKYIHMRYWPRVRSKWLDIGWVLFIALWTWLWQADCSNIQ